MMLEYQGCYVVGIGLDGCSLVADLLRSVSHRGIETNSHETSSRILSAELRWGWDPEYIFGLARKSDPIFVALNPAQLSPAVEPVRSLLDRLRQTGALTIGISLEEGLVNQSPAACGFGGYGFAVSIVRCCDVSFLTFHQDTARGSSSHELVESIQAIVDLVDHSQPISLEPSELEQVLKGDDGTLLSIGSGYGIDAMPVAVACALNNEFLHVALKHAKSVLCGILGGEGLTLFEVNESIGTIKARTKVGVDVVFGVAKSGETRDKARCAILVNSEKHKPLTAGDVILSCLS